MYQKIVLASVSVFLILFLVKIVFSLPFQDETLYFAFVSFHVGYKALIECRKQQQVI